MKAASTEDIRKELKTMPAARLTEICLRLARFKKENKELLTYILFEAADADAFITGVKEEIARDFTNLHPNSVYLAKKGIRKILRTAQKYIRYTGSKTAEADIMIQFCSCLRSGPIPFRQHTALLNLYHSQLKKIEQAVAALHDDLQHDYRKQLQQLQE